MNDQANILRTPDELQWAHDMLVGLIVDDGMRREILGLDEDGKILVSMKANADVLCWILGHDHNRTFEKNLDAIHGAMLESGYFMGER
jgi:hypothetical protein